MCAAPPKTGRAKCSSKAEPRFVSRAAEPASAHSRPRERRVHGAVRSHRRRAAGDSGLGALHSPCSRPTRRGARIPGGENGNDTLNDGTSRRPGDPEMPVGSWERPAEQGADVNDSKQGWTALHQILRIPATKIASHPPVGKET